MPPLPSRPKLRRCVSPSAERPTRPPFFATKAWMVLEGGRVSRVVAGSRAAILENAGARYRGSSVNETMVTAIPNLRGNIIGRNLQLISAVS